MILPQVLECGFLATTNPFFHVRRTAKFHVMIFVTEGCIYVTEDKTDYEIKAGQILFLKAGINHYGKYEIKKGTKWFYVHFDLEQETVQSKTKILVPKKIAEMNGTIIETKLEQLIQSFYKNSKKKELLDYHTENILQLARSKEFLQKNDNLFGEKNQEANKNLSNLEKEILNNGALKPDEFLKKIQEIMNIEEKWNCNIKMLEILKELCFWKKEIKPQKISLATKIALYLETLDNQEFNAVQVANYFCLSYKHLAATFKKEKNISMQHFHQKIRIDKACKLLRTTLLSIWEIANQTGWNDQLYFSRCFKNTMGMSPTEYRNLPLTY